MLVEEERPLADAAERQIARWIEANVGGRIVRIVRQGLNPGDKVIVEGLQKVFMPGMPVNAKTVAMTATSALN